MGRDGSCFAHLDGEPLAEEWPAVVDVRGTTFTPESLARLFRAFGRLPDQSLPAVRFDQARFDGDAVFDGVVFRANVSFAGARFGGVASFRQARFGGRVALTELGGRHLDLTLAVFAEPVEVSGAVDRVTCDGARFDAGVTLRVRQCRLSAERTVFGAAATIAGVIEPAERRKWVGEQSWADGLRLESLRGTDVSDLVLTDVDLSECTFAGAHRLDQLRVDGRRRFARPPGRRRTTRQVLFEEAVWRGWTPRPRTEIGATQVSALYRSLRKSFEDSKNEAGAGDFYYGEMEMRRHSTSTRRAERVILWLYWALSGYGQRAGRALCALLVLVATVGTLLAGWGQPPAEAAQVAVGAVFLRDQGTKLSEAGQWAVMVARILGPVLLALAVLAVRARVKR